MNRYITIKFMSNSVDVEVDDLIAQLNALKESEFQVNEVFFDVDGRTIYFLIDNNCYIYSRLDGRFVSGVKCKGCGLFFLPYELNKGYCGWCYENPIE